MTDQHEPDPTELKLVVPEEEQEDDGFTTALSLIVDDGHAYVYLTWGEDADLDLLAASLVRLQQGDLAQNVVNAIAKFAAVSGDEDSAVLLIEKVRGDMQKFHADLAAWRKEQSQEGMPMIRPRIAIPLAIRQGRGE